MLVRILDFGSEHERHNRFQLCISAYLMFKSLKNHGVTEEEHSAIFTMGAATMLLPMDEKMKFEQGDDGMTFGFVTSNIKKNNTHAELVISCLQL